MHFPLSGSSTAVTTVAVDFPLFSFEDFVGLDPAELVGESLVFPFAFSLFGFALLSLLDDVVKDDDVVVVVSLMTIFVMLHCFSLYHFVVHRLPVLLLTMCLF